MPLTCDSSLHLTHLEGGMCILFKSCRNVSHTFTVAIGCRFVEHNHLRWCGLKLACLTAFLLGCGRGLAITSQYFVTKQLDDNRQVHKSFTLLASNYAYTHETISSILLRVMNITNHKRIIVKPTLPHDPNETSIHHQTIGIDVQIRIRIWVSLNFAYAQPTTSAVSSNIPYACLARQTYAVHAILRILFTRKITGEYNYNIQHKQDRVVTYLLLLQRLLSY